MRSIPIIFLLLVVGVGGKAQGRDSTLIKPVYIKAAVYYDFPESFGASGGIDFPLLSKTKSIHKKDGSMRLRHKDLVFTNDIGFYHNPDNYSAFFLVSFISQRHLFSKGWYFENGLGLGVMRTLYDGKVYTVDENETVNEHDSFGRFYGSVHFFAVPGYNFETDHFLPLAIQLKPSLWFQYPYNSFVLPHGSIELAVKYHFKNWNTQVKHHTKQVVK